jgi:YD repeat-containing protein
MRKCHLFAALSLQCVWAFAAMLPTNAFAVDPKFLCNALGSHCQSPTPSEWQFGTQFGPFGFKTFSAAQSAFEASMPWCGTTVIRIDNDFVPGPWITSGTSPKMSYGLPYQHQHRIEYQAKQTPCPATGFPISTTYVHILQDRSVNRCAKGYTFIYEAGPPVIGPYCAKPWVDVDPAKNSCKGGVSRGNPCEVGSGHKRQRENDYRAGGVSPLGFSRYYNSWISRAGPLSGALPAASVGFGWTADYFQSIRFYPEGAIATAFAFRPDGERIAFNEVSGSFVASNDMDVVLSAQRNGSGAIIGWTLKTAHEDIETYDAGGKLLSIESRNGTTQTLAYSSGVLASVTDSFGNQLQFGFTSGRLSSVTLPGGSSISYGYDGSGRLGSVRHPGSEVRQYH